MIFALWRPPSKLSSTRLRRRSETVRQRSPLFLKNMYSNTSVVLGYVSDRQDNRARKLGRKSNCNTFERVDIVTILVIMFEYKYNFKSNFWTRKYFNSVGYCKQQVIFRSNQYNFDDNYYQYTLTLRVKNFL